MSSCAQAEGCWTSPVFQNPGAADEFPSQPFASCTVTVTIGMSPTPSSAGSACVRLHCSLNQFLTRE